MNGPAPQNDNAEHQSARLARRNCGMTHSAQQARSPLTGRAGKNVVGEQTEALPARAGLRGSTVAWYRLPILWLGALIFSASVAGCVLMILLGSRHDDEPLPDAGMTLLKMPLGSSAPSRDQSRGTQ
jgi:hypothetical protein